MYSLLYFDTEDFFSPPDSPVHQLPRHLADIMTKHGFTGCFHIHGEKARFMERHGQSDVITAIRRHNVSLHYDRGSIHPTTAEETSGMDWFEGIERVLFREVPGFQTMERIFGKCSALTQHGGTFSTQIVYAAGCLRYPYFYSPFRIPGRNVVWFCGNLVIGGSRMPLEFDVRYHDTAQFDASLARLDPYLDEQKAQVDYTALFGGHPVRIMMAQFPDTLNFDKGANPPREDWKAPTPYPNFSLPTVLQNFDRLIQKLASRKDVQWTSVAGMAKLYGHRPAQVRDAAILDGAQRVIENRGATFTPLLSAGELLYLLAKRAVRKQDVYDVVQALGPVPLSSPITVEVPATRDAEDMAPEIIECVEGTGYLPGRLIRMGTVSLESALLTLAGHAIGQDARKLGAPRPADEAIPSYPEALEVVKGYAKWNIHGAQYRAPYLQALFRRHAWSLKPAWTEQEYAKFGGVVELRQ